MLPLIGLAATFVPEIIRLIAGDKAGTVATTVTDAVAQIAGTADPVVAKQKLDSDPAALAALQQRLAEIALEATKAQNAELDQQRQDELARLKASVEGTAGARSTLLGLVSANSPIAYGSPIVSAIVTIGFFVILIYLIGNGAKTQDPSTFSIINIAIGVLGTAFATVVNFWLGSSSGSRSKDEQVIAMQQNHASQTEKILSTLQNAQSQHLDSTNSAIAALKEVATSAATSSRRNVEAEPASADSQPNIPAPATPASLEELAQEINRLTTPHKHFQDGVSWQLTKDGISIDGAPAVGSMGRPTTVTRIWTQYSDRCKAAAKEYGVPIELIVATIATESSGNPSARRAERRLRTESVGLMQTLVTTAQQVLGAKSLTGDDLLDPTTSIRAGTAYIAQQRVSTHFDPPLVAAAYNAGSLQRDDAIADRWKLLCYPANTGQYIDRFVQWFNDAMRVSEAQGSAKEQDLPSFVRLLA